MDRMTIPLWRIFIHRLLLLVLPWAYTECFSISTTLMPTSDYSRLCLWCDPSYLASIEALCCTVPIVLSCAVSGSDILHYNCNCSLANLIILLWNRAIWISVVLVYHSSRVVRLFVCSLSDSWAHLQARQRQWWWRVYSLSLCVVYAALRYLSVNPVLQDFKYKASSGLDVVPKQIRQDSNQQALIRRWLLLI